MGSGGLESSVFGHELLFPESVELHGDTSFAAHTGHGNDDALPEMGVTHPLTNPGDVHIQKIVGAGRVSRPLLIAHRGTRLSSAPAATPARRALAPTPATSVITLEVHFRQLF